MANTYSLDLEAGTSDYAYITDTVSLSITGDMTIEFWYKPESAPATDTNQSLISKYTGVGNQRSYRAFYQDSAGTKRLVFQVSSDGTAITDGLFNYTLTPGTWYHLAFVYTASTGTVEMYVNTSSIGTDATLATSVYNGTANFQIGQDPDGQADGLIDDVRVWNDIRSGAEITANYQTELTGTEANLQGYWKCNEGSGTNLNDETANANDLTIGGSGTFSSNVPFVEAVVNKSYAYFM